MESRLLATINEEMMLMMARQLEYAPAADDLPAVAKVMYHDLVRLGLKNEDSDRVRKAFQGIALNLGRWPTAFMVKENLPKSTVDRKALPNASLPKTVQENLERMGMAQLPGESHKDYAIRCAQYMSDNYDLGNLPDRLRKRIEKKAAGGRR